MIHFRLRKKKWWITCVVGIVTIVSIPLLYYIYTVFLEFFFMYSVFFCSVIFSFFSAEFSFDPNGAHRRARRCHVSVIRPTRIPNSAGHASMLSLLSLARLTGLPTLIARTFLCRRPCANIPRRWDSPGVKSARMDGQ